MYVHVHDEQDGQTADPFFVRFLWRPCVVRSDTIAIAEAFVFSTKRRVITVTNINTTYSSHREFSRCERKLWYWGNQRRNHWQWPLSTVKITIVWTGAQVDERLCEIQPGSDIMSSKKEESCAARMVHFSFPNILREETVTLATSSRYSFIRPVSSPSHYRETKYARSTQTLKSRCHFIRELATCIAIFHSRISALLRMWVNFLIDIRISKSKSIKKVCFYYNMKRINYFLIQKHESYKLHA